MSYKLNVPYFMVSHGGAGKCLNLYGNEQVSDHRNVCVWTRSTGKAQNWLIKAFGANYKIVTALDQSYALNYHWTSGKGNPGNCNIHPQAGNDADSSITLVAVNATDGVYKIKMKNYNLFLTAKGTGDNADVRWEAPVTSGTSQQWRLMETAGIQAPFIYTGFNYGGKPYSYTDAQLAGLDNATEFVVAAGAFLGYFTRTGEPNSTFVQDYVTAAAQMTKRLYNKYKKQVWIGTPLVAPPTSSGGSPYTVDHTQAVYATVTSNMTGFIDSVINEFSRIGLDFSTCVKGIYISDEGIYDQFDFSTTVASHPQVNMFQAVSNYAASKGLKMLWSPYWSTDNLVKAAHVIHRTSIFDYALIQPGYYFRDSHGQYWNEQWSLNCDAIREMIIKQRLCYQNKQQILHDSNIDHFRTKIGCQMEIDQKYVTDSTRFANLYRYYADTFGASVSGYSKAIADFGFYFSCPEKPDDAAYTTIKSEVNKFFQ